MYICDKCNQSYQFVDKCPTCYIGELQEQEKIELSYQIYNKINKIHSHYTLYKLSLNDLNILYNILYKI